MKERALGFIETRGYLGVPIATDAMNDAAYVDFIRQEHIGSGFVTTMVTGEVDSVEAAVIAGKEAAERVSKLIHAWVIPRIHEKARQLCIDWKLPEKPISNFWSLGLIETQGYVPMVVAADAAAKTSDIVLANYFTVGSGYSIIAMRGEVADMQSAVESGTYAARQVGKVVAQHIIPLPHGGIVSMLSSSIKKHQRPLVDNATALGFIETHGLVTLIVATDAALKSASVKLLSHRAIGAGIVTTVVGGDVAAVNQAIQAARLAGERIGKVLTTNVMPSPHAVLYKANS